MKHKILSVTLCCLILLVITGCGAPQKVKLFNDKNFDGWRTYLKDTKVNPADVWSVTDGVIHCKGKPDGYLRSTEEFTNYKLHIEWRWAGEPSNSGVLLHATGDDKLWPLCIEAQLKHGNAGDFVTIQNGSAITVNGVRYQSTEDKLFNAVSKQQPSSEYRVGQWNSYDIICADDTITLMVNGVLQNIAAEASLTSGAICLQSEGSPIEFRNIYIQPLK
ncbi:MAG: 3-keto-disaccharide hydrolase [Planctomycetota bacterium]|jgi:hypothetical protein